MGIRDRVVGQFRKPSGPFGHIVGWIMAARSSNRERSRWTVDLLHIDPDDRVLELGCGPGVALEQVARRLLSGIVTGIDHSPVMVKQAARRNREAIAAGRVLVRAGTIENVRAADGPFTKIFSVNMIQFLPDQAASSGACIPNYALAALPLRLTSPATRNPRVPMPLRWQIRSQQQ
jgi:SAM-dependent methyltransferase